MKKNGTKRLVLSRETLKHLQGGVDRNDQIREERSSWTSCPGCYSYTCETNTV
jgi:hypothetical protein